MLTIFQNHASTYKATIRNGDGVVPKAVFRVDHGLLEAGVEYELDVVIEFERWEL
jgi:hypothetical protein